MRVFIPFLVTAMTAAASAAGSADWKKILEETLETSIYVKSDVAALDNNRITAVGTMLIVKRPGILASPARYLGAANTRVRGGRIEQPGGLAALFAERNTTELRVGEAVYLTDIEVRDDKIIVELITRDLQGIIERGSTVQMRYKGQLEFEFDERDLAAADAVDLKRFFDDYFEEAP